MSRPIDSLGAALEDRYAIQRELGEGGMATVYLAEDLKHKSPVAIKVLKPELTAVVGAERFLVEIDTTAGLQHPRIIRLFDSGEADGPLIYVIPPPRMRRPPSTAPPIPLRRRTAPAYGGRRFLPPPSVPMSATAPAPRPAPRRSSASPPSRGAGG